MTNRPSTYCVITIQPKGLPWGTATMSKEESPPITRVNMNNAFLPKISNSHMENRTAGISKAPKRNWVKKMLKPRFPMSKYRQ